MYSHRFVLFAFSLVAGIAALSYCPPIEIIDYYESQNENGSNSRKNYSYSFPLTPINEFALTRELCVQSDGLPLVRKCLANQQWAQLDRNIGCRPSQGMAVESQSLSELQYELSMGISERSSFIDYPLAVMRNVSDLIAQMDAKIEPVDVLSINKIIDRVVNEPKDMAACIQMIRVYSDLMGANSSVLELSARLNATNDLLYKFEDYTNGLAPQLKSCNEPIAVDPTQELVDVKMHNGVQALIGKVLSVFYLFPECNAFTGIAIYTKPGPGREGCPHHGFWYRFLYSNQSLNALREEPDLLTASYLTRELWEALQVAGATYMVFKIYANNALFVDLSASNTGAKPASHVLSINIPQVSPHLPYPLAFLLRNEDFDEAFRKRKRFDGYCAYWNYGNWTQQGITTDTMNLSSSPIVACFTHHLTQFAFLVGASNKHRNCRYGLDRLECLLDTTTAVGCSLSLFGLLMIWLTAAISKRWRSLQSTKLLLNMCVALTLLFLLMLLLYVNEWAIRYSFDRGSWACIALGAVFQYAVLFLFSWMLLVGHLQYRKHVTVLVAPTENIVGRLAAIAWTMPLLPTLALLLVDPEAYSPVLSGEFASVCYPAGAGLIYGILLPIGLVLGANVFTFGCILFRVSRLRHRNGQLIWQQFRLFLLLFFLLGLTWIFGLCAYFNLGFSLKFLFCLLATVQGFVVFVYFVVFDRYARAAWVQLLMGQPTANVDFR
ncbi:hypothetical protein AWZ03_006598 [Drosophila navojoa]|uniref:G-protein coupled receptors family 2 profile 2 domain-containing protein n=1 Tax=Drosophila navojoa TaxID=7232 RepID=A0A484BDT4_DRONA|nr:adhesion G-protein coupled receptor G2-like [Drosophila navojoa]TDG47017.1 hypothetical protein AWZ03_006598 [Drosophila navojoa]